MFPDKKYLLLLAAIVAAAGLYCYNPFVLYFQNDDFIHIPLSAEGRLFQHNSFRPVCDLSVMLDYFFWHKHAWGYHLTNLLLHVLDTILVFIFCKTLFKKYLLFNNAFETSLLTALLFFIYPMHSEAVFWILGRSASLGVLFFLLSLIFYLKREDKKYLVLSVLFAIVAWLTYESTWILLIVFFIISLVDRRLKYVFFKNDLKVFLLFVVLFLFYLVARFYFIHQIVGEYEAGNFLQLNFSALADNFATLVIRSWLPFCSNRIFLIITLIVLLVIVTAVFFLQKQKTNKRFIIILTIVWLLSLLPYTSLGVDTFSSEGERFLYLPSVFCCIIISLFFFSVLKKNIFVGLFFVLVIVLFLFFLNRSSRNYVFAGNITRSFLEEINKINGEQKIFIDSLPQSQQGALIFSKGLPEAAKWIASDQHEIIINSFRNKNNSLKNPYAIKYITDTSPQIHFLFTDSALLIPKTSANK